MKNRSNIFFEKKSKLLIFSIFLLIIVVAFLLRARLFLFGDFYFLVDQARDLLLTKSIVVDHKITLIGARTGEGGLFHGPLWLYMIAPFFMIAHGDPFFTLVPLFILVSLGIVISGFYIGYKLYNEFIGLTFALLLTISSPLVQTVPFTTNSQVLPLIFIFYLYSIIQYIRGKNIYFVSSLIFIGLGIQFESAFAILFVPLTLFALIIRRHIPTIKIILLGIGGFILTISTFILFDLRHKFLMTTTAIKLLTQTHKPLPGYEQYANIGFRIQDRLQAFIGSIFTPLFSVNLLSNVLLLIILIIPICFLIKTFLRKQQLKTYDKEYVFLLISPIIIYGLYVFYPLPLWPHYLLAISILSCFILSLSFYILTKLKYGLLISVIPLIIFATPAIIWIGNNYLTKQTYTNASDGSYQNQLKVAQWVIDDANTRPSGYFVYSSGILTYNMDYLIWWTSQRRRLNLLLSQKKQTTYLILYPHLANDLHAYDYWKRNVVRTKGVVVLTKNFSSGISVEKLQLPPNDPSPDPNYYQDLIFR